MPTLAPKLHQRAVNGIEVPATEQTHMDEQRIKIVEIAALLEEPGPEGPVLVVARKESVAESAEKYRKSKLDFRVCVINRGVNKTNDIAA